jgi:hypothetical protein
VQGGGHTGLVKLSGKVLTILERPALRGNQQGNRIESSDSEYQVSASESEDPEGSQGEETGEPVHGFSHLTDSDWKRVAAFENQIIAHHSNFDIKEPGS